MSITGGTNCEIGRVNFASNFKGEGSSALRGSRRASLCKRTFADVCDVGSVGCVFGTPLLRRRGPFTRNR